MNLFGWTFFAALVYGALLALFGACGDSGTDKELDSPYTEKRTLAGFVQKGPFTKGSKISIQELDAVTLLPVGEKIEGSVQNDEGTYSLEFDEFESPYALLTAVGTYRDELTGEDSKVPVTLNALVDLTARKSANVNLLTHLEYLRVLYLVKDEGVAFAEAKMRAEQEVLAAFAIRGDFALAEDLNIYSSGDGDAALFAISVLMLGNLEKEGGSELPFGLVTKSDGEEKSKLAERISDFAEDLESDGIWKNVRVAANMADWAVEQGLNGKFSSFRTQVISYIDSFWWNIYGFDACDSELEGSAWLNDEPNSVNRGVYFICKNGKWIPEKRNSVQVKDTTGVADTTVADTLNNLEKDTWRHGTELDSILVSLGGTACLHVGDTSDVKYDGKYYMCMENVDSEVPQEWIILSALYNDTHDDLAECNAAGLYGNGTLHNKFDDKSRVYACDDGEFRHVNRAELLLWRGCTSYNRGELLQMNLSHFVCSDGGWVIDQENRGDGVMVDPRDGQEYRTIGIWKQTWMAENMNYTDATELTVLRGRTWCYDDDPEKCNEYGALYGCAAAREVCPDGWRLPVKADWDSLIAFYQDIGWNRGQELRSGTGWTDYEGVSANGNDFSGFTALPAGFNTGDGMYEGEGHEAWFWYDAGCEDDVRRYGTFANYEGFFGYWYKDDAEAGYYVRCIKSAE